MRRVLFWGLAALLVVLLTVVFSLPAAWLTPLIEKQTHGRLTLGDPEGKIGRAHV